MDADWEADIGGAARRARPPAPRRLARAAAWSAALVVAVSGALGPLGPLAFVAAAGAIAYQVSAAFLDGRHLRGVYRKALLAAAVVAGVDVALVAASVTTAGRASVASASPRR